MSILIELDQAGKISFVNELIKNGINFTEIDEKHFNAELIIFSLVVPSSLTIIQLIHQHFATKSKPEAIFRIFLDGVEVSPDKITVEAIEKKI